MNAKEKRCQVDRGINPVLTLVLCRESHFTAIYPMRYLQFMFFSREDNRLCSKLFLFYEWPLCFIVGNCIINCIFKTFILKTVLLVNFV